MLDCGATTLEHTPMQESRWMQSLQDANAGAVVAKFPLPVRPTVARSEKSATTTNGYVAASGFAAELAVHYEKLDALAVDPSLWPRGADGPGTAAIQTAKGVLIQISEATASPARVVASAEGGVAICFVCGDKYADIECLNSGEILGVTTNRRDLPTAWELERSPASIADTLSKITRFLLQTTVADASGRARR